MIASRPKHRRGDSSLVKQRKPKEWVARTKDGKMDRISAGPAYAIDATDFDAYALNDGFVRDFFSEEVPRPQLSHGQAVRPMPPLPPAAFGLRSERVLSLVLALEALRAAPGLLDVARDGTNG